MRVVAYVRCSTDEQDRSGLGLEAQEGKIKAYCSLYDLQLVSIEKDAMSGKSLKGRTGLQKSLDMLKEGTAEGLIVAKLDRLTRSVRDLGELIEVYFNKYALFSVSEQVDTRSASGRLVLNILCSVAQWERETIGERTSDALHAKRQRGEKTGGACPYGYHVDGEGRLVEEPVEQKILRSVYALHRQGFSSRKIAAELRRQGYANRRGSSDWKSMTVCRMVKAMEARP